MIYFFNNDLGLEKVVTSSNTLIGNHEHELNNLIRADIVLDLEHALSFIDDVDFFGYYYKDVFYLHKITRQETEHEAEVMVLAGRHIFFEDMLYSEVIKDIRPQNRDAKYMLDQAIGGHTRWNVVMTDVTGTLSTNFYWQMPYEALEWIVEHFRLEYLPVILFDGQKINGYELHVKKRLGENKGIRIPWGERVEKLNYEVDYSEIVTQLAPRGKGEEIGEDIYSRRINISDVNFSRDGVVSPVGNLYLEDKSLTAKYGNDGGKPRKGEGEFYDIDDVNELAEAGYQMYLDVSRPQVVISADVVDIGDVTIGDGVNIIRREHDLYFEARVHKISVDLLNPDDAQIELGDYEHFKESKLQKSNKKRIEIIEKEVYGQIHQYKIEFDENFNAVVEQWREEQEQALIDVHAEIEASEQRHDDKWEQYEAEIDGNIERIVGGSLESLDTNLLDVNSRLLSKLDESDLQPLHGRIDDAFSDISDVSGNLNTVRLELQEKLNDVSNDIIDVSGNLDTTRSQLQGQLDDAFNDISDVSGNLDTARSDLQQQLDKARADLEGMEVGGRNLLPAFTSNKWSHANITEIEDYSLYLPSGYAGHSIIFIDVEKQTNYTMTFNSDYSRYYIYEVLEDESLGSIIRTRTGSETYTFNTGDINKIRVSLNTFSGNVQEEKNIWNLKLEKGTFATDWTPAPEDVEEKITTLSESIEYIDGQLEAKLNRTEIEPIQNKITEYGTTLDANAESIGLLQDKTQLHDDDIEKWSNQATSTAEEVSRILTHNSEQDNLITSVTNESRETAEGLERTINRVSKTESDISTAKVDIIANADLIGATMTRVDENDQSIGEFQATADGLKADFTRYQSDFGDDMSAIQSQVASYEANVDGFRAEVGVLSKDVSSVELWQREKGAVIDGNADAIRTRIWKNDIDELSYENRNLLLNSGDVKSDGSSVKQYPFNFEGLEHLLGQELTISFYARLQEGEDRGNSIDAYLRSDSIIQSSNSGVFHIIDEWTRFDYTFIVTQAMIELTTHFYIRHNQYVGNNSSTIRIESKKVKIEKGSKMTPWSPAPEDIQSDITQLNTDITIEAGRINGLLTRTSEVEQSIADVNLNVDGITADFANYKKDIDSDVGALSTQVASYEASVDGFRAEVGTLQGDINDVDRWMSEKGVVIDGNADAIRTRIWKQDIDAIEVGGRNLFSVNQYVSLRNSEGTTNGNRYSVGSSGALVVGGVDGSGGYDTMKMVDLKANTEYIFTFNIPINDRFSFYDTDGVAISVAKKWGSNNTQLIFKMGNVDGYIGGKFYPIEQSYPVEIYLMAEKGNKATDWTPAPEDVQSEITQLNTDITVEAGRINALLTRTSSAEKSIADINSSVDGITADFANYKKDIDSDVGALSSQVASYEASVSGFRAEVGTLQGDINDVDSWISQKGSIIDGNADAISARVWNKDIDDLKIGGRNLLRNSNADDLDDVATWRVWQSERGRATVGGKIFVQSRTTGSTSFGLQLGYYSGDRFEVVEGRDYIISFEGYSSLTARDFDYVYLMRADGGNQGSLSPYKVEDAPLPGASNNKRYYFKLKSWFSSTEAYLLIGSRPKPEWADTSEAKWVRFRKPQIIEGTKEVPYSKAPENFLQHTDFILESDGFFLGGKYVGGDHYSTAIVGSKDGIDILAQRMRVTGDLLVKGDVETYALNAVHGDITNLRSKLLTANVVKSTHLSVGSALANKFNANSAFISRLEVQAANVRDLTGTHIRGGLLDSLNGATRLNLNTGDWTIGGSASIEFTDTRNALYFSRGVEYAGAGFDIGSTGNNLPISYIGTSVDSINTNNQYWTGLIVSSNSAQAQGSYSSLTSRSFVIRQMRNANIGFMFDLTPGRRIFRPWGSMSDSYDLGSGNSYFQRLYAQHIRVNDSVLNIRSQHNTNRGFVMEVEYSQSSSSWMHFRGANSGSSWRNPQYYALGASNAPFQRAFINAVTEGSDVRLKQDIIDNDLGLDFINDIKTREYTLIDTKDRKNGVVAQEMLEVLEKHNVSTDAQSIVSIDEMLGVEYTQLISPTIRAVQEVDVKVETNITTLASHQSRIETTEEKIARLEKEIELLKGE